MKANHHKDQVMQPGQSGLDIVPDIEALALEDQPAKERWLRKVLIGFGVMILAYVYSSSLLAQQASQQRISVSQAVNFPNDI
ncbi:hypothetical protein [Kordiimonas sp. SCSIO 12610]|uniref:hypothetical protein n=1 Tax=Kordiimonas sp. SCSIO 12610 TaxID=2829597 RepID=UPI00210D99C3|nr:hypothetical protein [Kordiimonas sp. SCSIO 12610]UTW55663.1 hypothetical protein KFF44_01870 [Kordiimonas sp. SCSIO 12610]